MERRSQGRGVSVTIFGLPVCCLVIVGKFVAYRYFLTAPRSARFGWCCLKQWIIAHDIVSPPVGGLQAIESETPLTRQSLKAQLTVSAGRVYFPRMRGNLRFPLFSVGADVPDTTQRRVKRRGFASLPSPLLSFAFRVIPVVLVNRVHRKCCKHPAGVQLQCHGCHLASHGLDRNLAPEIGGVRIGENLLDEFGNSASGLDFSIGPFHRVPYTHFRL